jgi:hypothetical protein
MDWDQREVNRRQQELRQEAGSLRLARGEGRADRQSLIARVIAIFKRQASTTGDSLTVFHVSSDPRHEHHGDHHAQADLVQMSAQPVSACSGASCAPAD